MSIEQVFLGWDKALLHAASAWLWKKFLTGTTIDLREKLFVFPGGRALRRLTEIFVEMAEKEGVQFIPPQMITVGMLPEELISKSSNLASDTQCLFFWIDAIKGISKAKLGRISSFVPDDDDIYSWLLLAQRFDSIYSELSGSLQTFSGVLACLKTYTAFSDEERWEVLSEIHDQYVVLLAQHNLQDQHRQRIQTLNNSSFHYQKEVFLFSTSDLPLVTKDLLSLLDSTVTSFIHAPESQSDLFDEHGCVKPKKWLDVEIPISADQFEVVQKASDQAMALMEKLASLEDRHSVYDVTVGICDDTIAPYVTQAFWEEGYQCRNAAGEPVGQSELVLFLKALNAYLRLKRFSDFASLLRIPCVRHWVREQFRLKGEITLADTDFLALLDKYQTHHLQAVVDANVFGKGDMPETVKKLFHVTKELIGDFLDERKDLKDWCGSVVSLIIRLYGDVNNEAASTMRDDSLEVCEHLRTILQELFNIKSKNPPKVEGRQVLSFLLQRLSSLKRKPEPTNDAIELLGWLELQLDDASILAITGFNEGFVPESVNSDPFLPDSLRRHIGLMDNDLRYARDAFALSAMLHSKEQLCLICGKENMRGDKLLPSRLLYACDKNTLVKRVDGIFSENGDNQNPILRHSHENHENAFVLPVRPELNSESLKELSVSGIGDYLKCPYLFYLKHVLGIEKLDDEDLELDARSFGSLAHDVLSDFGYSEVKDSTDMGAIYGFLSDCLDKKARTRYGSKAMATVLVQIAQLKARFEAFAVWQSSWRTQGWVIKEVELEFQYKVSVSNKEILIKGRIDRIDYNASTSSWMIFDYKTGDDAKEPDKVHRKRKEWVDLQLPIYLDYWSRHKGIKESIQTAYICIPADPEQVNKYEANWSDELLASAQECTTETCWRILAQEYWPPHLEQSFLGEYRVLYGKKDDYLLLTGEES